MNVRPPLRAPESRFLILALVALLAARGASATEFDSEAAARDADIVIMKVSYVGSFKTWPSRLAILTALKPGMRLGEARPDDIVQRLRKTGLYSEVGLEYESVEGGAEILVRLKEKWTLIPLPFAQFTKDRTNLGFFLFDSDFAGSRAVVVAGGAWVNDGWMATLGYIEPSLGEGKVGLTFFTAGGSARRSSSYQDGTGFSSFQQYTGSSSLSLGFMHDRPLRPQVSASLRYVKPDAADALRLALAPQVLVAAPSVGLSWDRTRRETWYDTGMRASLSAERGFGFLGGADYWSATARLSLSAAPGGLVLLAAGASGEYGDKSALLQRDLSGPGFRVLPRSSSCSARYGGAWASAEVPFVRLGWATLTVAAFGEAGLYSVGPDGKTQTEAFYGAGAGLRAYVRDIAVPAMGADFGFNARTGMPVISVYVGAQAGG
jgi:hypothetical protein